jgi:hypothetical protein
MPATRINEIAQAATHPVLVFRITGRKDPDHSRSMEWKHGRILGRRIRTGSGAPFRIVYESAFLFDRRLHQLVPCR